MAKFEYEVRTWLGTDTINAMTRNTYAADGTLQVQLWCDDGPYATLTVCLGLKKEKKNKNIAFLDTNNFPDGPAFVEKMGIGKPLGLHKTSGFCTYPLYIFDLEKVESLCGF